MEMVSTYTTKCADCGLDTIAAGEWYMVHDQIWQQAWGSLEYTGPGQQVLCIGCLENRIGRKLTSADFTAASVNDYRDEGRRMSDRLYFRLTDWC
jgi:hypothetical protein